MANRNQRAEESTYDDQTLVESEVLRRLVPPSAWSIFSRRCQQCKRRAQRLLRLPELRCMNFFSLGDALVLGWGWVMLTSLLGLRFGFGLLTRSRISTRVTLILGAVVLSAIGALILATMAAAPDPIRWGALALALVLTTGACSVAIWLGQRPA